MTEATIYHTADYVFVGGKFQKDMFIGVNDDEIVSVTSDPHPDVSVTTHRGAAIFPGAVNTHTHSYLSLLRGSVDFLQLPQYLEIVYASIGDFGTEESYLGAAHSFGEALLSGTTTMADFFYLNGDGNDNIRAALQAATELGIRLVMGRTFLDAEWGGTATRETVSEAHSRFVELRADFEDDPLIEVSPAPHSLYGASRPMVEAAFELATEYDTKWYVHIADSEKSGLGIDGVRSIPLLDGWGILDEHLVNVHAVWLDDDELRLLGEKGGLVSYCPASNMVFGERVLDIPGYKAHGITVGLGTDSAASNNTQDMFADIRLSSLCQRLGARNPTAVSVEDMLAVGTADAAKVVGLPVGELAAGYKADFAILDIDDPSLNPHRSLASHVCHSMNSRAVRDVFVGGRQVVKDRELTGLDMSSVLGRLNRSVDRILGPSA